MVISGVGHPPPASDIASPATAFGVVSRSRPSPRRALKQSGEWRAGKSLRLVVLIALTVFPFWGIYNRIGLAIFRGSPIAYLIVIPLLAAMIAFGYRTPPRGIGDPESDWILAGIFGGLGLFLRHLMSVRFPTLSGLWQLPLVGAVLWAACLAAVLFGVRRVMQTWALWAFVFVTATPLPYLLAIAAAGGGAIAVAGVTGVLGGAAVAIAGALAPLAWRLTVGAASSAASIATGFIVVGAGADHWPHSALVVALLTGGVIPLAGFLLLQSRSPKVDARRESIWPKRSPLSLAVLVIAALLVFVLNVPFARGETVPPRARADWTARAKLSGDQNFPFIARYLGPDATFMRYAVESRPGYPEAAVDVISADNLAALRTYRDAIWYPATVPPNYRPFVFENTAVENTAVEKTGVENSEIFDGRVTATDSSLATNGHAIDWYLVTWLWQSGTTYQQVFVVVNQTWTSHDPPPSPAQLSLRATVIGPALWLARQQADPSTEVDPLVTARAQQIVAEVLSAGDPRHG